jgi:hypothetical protein
VHRHRLPWRRPLFGRSIARQGILIAFSRRSDPFPYRFSPCPDSDVSYWINTGKHRLALSLSESGNPDQAGRSGGVRCLSTTGNGSKGRIRSRLTRSGHSLGSLLRLNAIKVTQGRIDTALRTDKCSNPKRRRPSPTLRQSKLLAASDRRACGKLLQAALIAPRLHRIKLPASAVRSQTASGFNAGSLPVACALDCADGSGSLWGICGSVVQALSQNGNG